MSIFDHLTPDNFICWEKVVLEILEGGRSCKIHVAWHICVLIIFMAHLEIPFLFSDGWIRLACVSIYLKAESESNHLKFFLFFINKFCGNRKQSCELLFIFQKWKQSCKLHSRKSPKPKQSCKTPIELFQAWLQSISISYKTYGVYALIYIIRVWSLGASAAQPARNLNGVDICLLCTYPCNLYLRFPLPLLLHQAGHRRRVLQRQLPPLVDLGARVKRLQEGRGEGGRVLGWPGACKKHYPEPEQTKTNLCRISVISRRSFLTVREIVHNGIQLLTTTTLGVLVLKPSHIMDHKIPPPINCLTEKWNIKNAILCRLCVFETENGITFNRRRKRKYPESIGGITSSNWYVNVPPPALPAIFTTFYKMACNLGWRRTFSMIWGKIESWESQLFYFAWIGNHHTRKKSLRFMIRWGAPPPRPPKEPKI